MSFHVAGTLVHNEHEAHEDGRHIVHVQDFTTSEATAVVAYGLARNLGLQWVHPIRRVETQIEFEELDGRPVVLPGGDIHHRNETLAGTGDPWLLVVAETVRGAWTFSGQGGVSVPLGRTEENPFALGREGRAHQHIQFGTGTWDPLLGLAAGRRLGTVTARLLGLARLPLATNRHGYRAGPRYSLILGGDRALGSRWGVRAGLDLVREEAETWGGVLETEGNLGRTDLLASASLSRALGPAGTASLNVSVPLRTQVRGAQVDYPLILGLGWSR